MPTSESKYSLMNPIAGFGSDRVIELSNTLCIRQLTVTEQNEIQKLDAMNPLPIFPMPMERKRCNCSFGYLVESLVVRLTVKPDKEIPGSKLERADASSNECRCWECLVAFAAAYLLLFHQSKTQRVSFRKDFNNCDLWKGVWWTFADYRDP